MTTRRKQIFIIVSIALIAIVFISILREKGIFNYNLYRSGIISNASTKWDDGWTTTNYTTGPSNGWRENVTAKCNFDGKLAGTPVVVVYQSKGYGDPAYCNPFVVDIDNISFGLLWTPLFKSSRLSAMASCSIRAGWSNIEGKKFIQTIYTIKGLTTVDGHITIG